MPRAFIGLSLLTCVLSMVAPFDAVAFTGAEVNSLIKCQKSIEAEMKNLSGDTLNALRECIDAKLPPLLQFENGVIDSATFAALDALANTKCTNKVSRLGPETTTFANTA